MDYSQILLHLPAAGPDGSNVFEDISAYQRQVTPTNGAVQKFAPAGGPYPTCCTCTGVACLEIANSDDFNLNGAGTVECYAYIDGSTNAQHFAYYGAYGSNEPWSVIYDGASRQLISQQSYGTPFRSDPLNSLEAGWHHIRLVGSGSEYAWAVDGVRVGYRNSGMSFPNQSSLLHVCGIPWASVPGTRLSDFIVTKEVLPSSGFVPPVRSAGIISNQSAGPIKDAFGNPVSRRIQAVTRSYPKSRVFTAMSDSDGRFSLAVPKIECSVGFLEPDDVREYGDIWVSGVMPV